MKASTFLIVGGAAIIGVVVYNKYKAIQSKKEDPDTKSCFLNKILDSDAFSISINDDIIHIKAASTSAITERHLEAAQTIESSLQTIFDDSKLDTIETENSKALEKIDADLDDLLK